MTAAYWKPDLPPRECAECGATYKPNKRAQRFCGKVCSSKVTNRKRYADLGYSERTCPHCSKAWVGPPSNPSRYCSKACVEADWKEGRKRECAVCASTFYVPRAGRAGVTCSDSCLSAYQSKIQTGRKASAETRAKMSESSKAWHADPQKREEWLAANREGQRRWHSDPANAAEFAKRSSERMKRRHADPEWQKVRDKRSAEAMRQNWEKYRDYFTACSAERYAEGIGIAAPEARARSARAAKWILKRANDALHTETDYNETYARVQAHIREEQPFDGGDYYEYCRWLGTQVVNSPECRAIADSFLSEAIPRFAAEWQRRKADTTRARV